MLHKALTWILFLYDKLGFVNPASIAAITCVPVTHVSDINYLLKVYKNGFQLNKSFIDNQLAGFDSDVLINGCGGGGWGVWKWNIIEY